MTTSTNHDSGTGDDRSPDVESAAQQRFVHGLLEFMHNDDAARRDQRVGQAINRVTAADSERRRRAIRSFAPLTTAAVLALAVVALFVLTPQPSAYAIVQATIDATRTAPGLRYDIIVHHDHTNSNATTIGTLDVRGEFMLVRIATPHGHEFVMGRDAEGEWSLRRDGSIERNTPRGAAPRWIDTGERTILVGSLVGLLEELDANFDVNISDDPPSAPTALTQLVATRRQDATGPGPEKIIVWIEPDTDLVNTLELHLNNAGRPSGQPGPGQRRHPGADPPSTDRPRPRHHPQLLSTKPGFDQGRHPPPPPRIVFQRIEALQLTDEQFTPPGS